MSGQWEVVGKKKDKPTKQPVVKTNNNIQKKTINKVKIDEVCKYVLYRTTKILIVSFWIIINKILVPKSQVQNLYNSNKSNKENKKPNEKPKTPENNVKKTQKKEKSQELAKPKPPKSIESALNNVCINLH